MFLTTNFTRPRSRNDWPGPGAGSACRVTKLFFPGEHGAGKTKAGFALGSKGELDISIPFNDYEISFDLNSRPLTPRKFYADQSQPFQITTYVSSSIKLHKSLNIVLSSLLLLHWSPDQ